MAELELVGIGPHFLYFVLSIGVTVAFLAIYLAVTPYPELALIRQGNIAASISFGGAAVGFSLALARAVAQSVSIMDMLIWSGVALASQLLAYFAVRLVVPGLPSAIEQDRVASGILLAVAALCAGMLNAASMTL